MAAPVVVVGASLGGVRIAQSLRDYGYGGGIVLIGAESELPYDRPPLSKGLLTGSDSPMPALLASREELDAADIDLRLGVAATGLDPLRHEVTLDTGEVLAYSSLVIATGSNPFYIEGWGRPQGVHELRTYQDCLDLRAGLKPGVRLGIVGAGFIGAEVASSARRMGAEVVIVDNTPAPLSIAIGEYFADLTTAMHEDAGIALHHNVTVVGIEGEPHVTGIRLQDGRVIDADLVLVCIGARPAVAWLEASGLDIANGVVCDEYLEAAPGVYAVGDVANWHNTLLDERMRVEHWTTTGDQAKYVAKVIATGERGAGFGTLPFVWSDQFGHHIEMVGRRRPTDSVRVIEGSLQEQRFVAVYERGGVEVAAVAFDSPRAMLQLRRRLSTAHTTNGAILAGR